MSRIVKALVYGLSTAAIVAGATGTAWPRDFEEAGRLIEDLESPADVGGEDDALDAAEAQGESIERRGGAFAVSGRAAGRIEEITVKARKREELLEDTPVAVTALGEGTLRAAGVARLDEITDLVPNLTFLAGRSGQDATVFIRGIGQGNSPILTFDPGVGIYVDGVYLARAQGSIIDVVDVEQIEVLRGPQGTLFGKNTIGGAINITTIKPHDELEAFAMVRAGSRDTVQTRAALNVPIRLGWFDDKLFSRIAFGSANSRGYTYNTVRDEWWSDTNSLSFLGSLRFLPTDDLTVDVSGSWSRTHTRTLGGQCVFIQDTPTMQAFWPPRESFYEECARSEPFRFQSAVASLNDIESFGTWGTITWEGGDLGPVEDLELKSLSSWRKQIPRLREDYDMAEQAVAQASAVGGPGDFVGLPGRAQQISQELQATGAALDGALSFVAGLYGFWENGGEYQSVRAFPGPLTPGPSPLGDLTTATTRKDTVIDNWSWALFTQVGWNITDWMSLTGGIRYTREKKGLALDITRPPLPPQDPVQPSLDVVDVAEAARFDAWTPMASLALRAPDGSLEDFGIQHLLGYFSFSRGFKSGGFNGMAREDGTTELPAFEPEYLDSYEVGIKGFALDERVTLNLAVFLGAYTDQQVQSVVLGPPLVPDGPPQVSLAVNNAAESTIKGLEIETTLLPVEGLLIQADLALLDTRFDEFLAPSALDGGAVIDRAGERFPFIPEIQAHIGMQYSMPIDSGGPAWLDGWITPRLDWAYQGSVLYAGPELPAATQRGYNLLHARLSYDFLDDRAQIAAWGQNLLDEAYFEQVTGSAQSFGQIARFYQAPRTAGVEFSYRFQ
jgi:iron complex outermembrane receptor protein